MLRMYASELSKRMCCNTEGDAMANDKMFTTRLGRQVPCKDLVIPADAVTSIMRLQEEYAARGHNKSLLFTAIDMLAMGKDTIERRWASAEKNKANRNAGKAVKEYIRVQLQLRRPIDPLIIAELSGMQIPPSYESAGEPAEFDDISEANLTDEQLEQATSPTGHVS